MPYAVITTTLPLTDEQRFHLHRDIAGLLVTVLEKNADLTAVRIEETPPTHWAVGGWTGTAAHLDVKITENTNTPDQKRRFVAAAHEVLRDVLGDLPYATYVVIDEVPAANWGYGGRTQGERKAG